MRWFNALMTKRVKCSSRTTLPDIFTAVLSILIIKSRNILTSHHRWGHELTVVRYDYEAEHSQRTVVQLSKLCWDVCGDIKGRSRVPQVDIDGLTDWQALCVFLCRCMCVCVCARSAQLSTQGIDCWVSSHPFHPNFIPPSLFSVLSGAGDILTD